MQFTIYLSLLNNFRPLYCQRVERRLRLGPAKRKGKVVGKEWERSS